MKANSTKTYGHTLGQDCLGNKKILSDQDIIVSLVFYFPFIFQKMHEKITPTITTENKTVSAVSIFNLAK